jgi:hypothetical protein
LEEPGEKELRERENELNDAWRAYREHLQTCDDCRTVDPCAKGKELKASIRAADAEYDIAYRAWEKGATA